jgi:hypothetical protein
MPPAGGCLWLNEGAERLMGNVEDFRKVVQDLVAPDLKALEARISALEREMNLRFVSAEQLASSRHETVLAAMAAHHASIMNALEMEKRLARLESERGRIESRDQQQ